MMDPQYINWHDVCRLALLLRENGDRVLSGKSKLRLTPALLIKLNTAFSGVSIIGYSNDFQVTSAHASQPPSISQLHFLHDFVQKTLGLTIAGSTFRCQDINLEGSIDLGRFRSLRHLELKSCIPTSSNDPSHVLKGLNNLRSQLETLVLMHIVCDHDLLWSILANGAVAIGPDIVWARLSQLVVCYCGLRSLGSSLSLANNLQWLDVSHNMLTDSAEVGNCLGTLPKLRYLNLSFNRLTGIPIPSSSDSPNATATQLQFLLLTHNYIDNLNGIDSLTGLVELNLTANQLQDHRRLQPLRALFQIQHLKLEGNPVAFHKNHRMLTAQFLSPRAVFLKHRCRRDTTKPSPFLLNGKKLSIAEMNAVQVGSIFPLSCSENDINDSMVSSCAHGSVQSNVNEKEKVSRKNRKVRHVVIADLDANATENTTVCAGNNSCGSLESSGEHLRTKEELESVRKRFGQENWLRAKARPAVQELLGMLPSTLVTGNTAANSLSAQEPLSTSTPRVSPGTSVTSPYTSQLDVETMENLVLDIHPSTTNNRIESQNAVVGSAPTTTPSFQSTPYITANESDSVLQVTAHTLNMSDETTLINANMMPQEVNVLEGTCTDEDEINIETGDYDGDIDDDSEVGDHSKFLVQEVDSGNHVLGDLFLVICPRYIKEINPSTGLRRRHWLLDTLQSCVMISANPCFVQLTFNTVVQSKKERIYQMDDNEAQQQLLPMLQKILESRSLSAMNFAAFRCMNCSAEFSADLKSRKGSRKCPTCGSVLIFELDEAPLPSSGSEKPKKSQFPESKETAPAEISDLNSSLIHSSSCSSIGSAASLESPNNPVQHITSTTTNLRRCESDIDIISNPSQSSIEVLDDIGRSSGTPGRKRSSEERQVVAVPSLHPVPECSSTLAPLPAGLTESSSSGSLTDSVCTAYESNLAGTTVGISHRIPNGLASTALKEEASRENSPQHEEKSESPQPVPQPTSLSNVLDGLLQTMSSRISAKGGTERKIQRKFSASENFIQYNYTDFSSIDHRLKLHLCLCVLDADEREVIQLLLRAEVVTCSSMARYPGILIITSKRVYVIKITGPEEGERVDRWFSRVIALPRKSIQRIVALPWSAGILISMQGSSNIDLMFILRDAQYLDSFFSFLNKLPQESTWTVESVAPEKFAFKVDKTLASLAEESFGSVSSCSLNLAVLICGSCIEQDEDRHYYEGGLLVVTSNGLLLCNDDFAWLLPPENLSSDSILKCIAKQLISNLIEVESRGLDLLLHFLDEIVRREEVWRLTLQSASVRGQVITAIRNPWEELFSVPLQVTDL